jgi:hypothetical protein
MKEKVRRVVVIGAKINEHQREIDRLTNELEKLLGTTEAPKLELAAEKPSKVVKGEKTKRRVLSDDVLEAGVLRYLKSKGSITPTLAAELLRASAPRTKKLLEKMRKAGTLEMRVIKVKAGRRMHPSQRYVSSEASASNGKH